MSNKHSPKVPYDGGPIVVNSAGQSPHGSQPGTGANQAFPEYNATEYAPSVVDVSYDVDEYPAYDEPTRIFIPAEELEIQARSANDYQSRVEQVYPSRPPSGLVPDVPYSPHQAYAPYTPGLPPAAPQYTRPPSGSVPLHTRPATGPGVGAAGIPQHQVPPQPSPGVAHGAPGPGTMAIVESQASRVVVVYPTAVRPPSPELIMVQRPDTTSADQYRMLRFKLVDRPVSQVIGVVGPKRGVGTSITAANLSLALAEAGRARVVLVDCDVRGARQGEIFGIESDAGLTVELERRHANPDIAARVVAVAAAMAIVPAGHDVPNPTAMLGSDVMARLLEDLRMMYDHIVLDLAPVLERSDAAAIHNLVDAFLMIAMSNVTTTDEIEKSEEKLPQKKIAGLVLNSVPKSPRGMVRNLLSLMGAPKRRKRYLARGRVSKG